ncbi:TetR/AcrR family transcriptional regulator [Corynebacterium pacaense]|uniref:TetR/AcrR family transcriptional regulator n=1 Tax=Corynebacterium pacaense TaxID=1816684 RepID=UPI0009B97CB7|nr:TetR/AcrR family transcriptional regulator [Corynebacterium pacaense]
MSTRERILDTYEAILIGEGERAATFDQIAANAGVSKGGLLYHFPDKRALAQGLLDRLRALVLEDAARMEVAPEGPSAYYISSSAFTGDPLDRALLAATRLGPEGGFHLVREIFDEVQAIWFRLILAEVGDEPVARAIMLIGDGLYYNALLTGGLDMGAAAVEPGRIRELIGVVDKLKSLA